MCDYKNKCSEAVKDLVGNSNLCSGTGNNCIIYPTMKDADRTNKTLELFRKREDKFGRKLSVCEEIIQDYRIKTIIQNSPKLRGLKGALDNL